MSQRAARHRLHWRVHSLAVVLVVGLFGLEPRDRPSPAVAERSTTDRPNIVLITTDDQNRGDLRLMPRTRELLGRAGATFRNMLTTHPLCCPSRAELLTGQYAQNNGVRSNLPKLHGGHAFLDNENTIATWLHEGGYQTAFVGKYLNGYPPDGVGNEPGWDIWNPTTRKIYAYFGYETYNNGAPVVYDDLHHADMVAQQSVQYIAELAPSDQPFFLWASHVAPHKSCQALTGVLTCRRPPVAASRHRGLFRGVKSPSLLDPAFNEQDMSDKSPHETEAEKVDRRYVNRLYRGRLRSLQAVDEAVAETVRALEAAGELDNTLVVFTSDNGFLLGEHRQLGKDVPYEEALRVPLILRGPGIPAGVRRQGTALMVDLAPTFLEVSGATPTHVLDGVSLMPLARDGGRQRGAVLIQAGPRRPSEIAAGWGFRGVRTDRYTYARHPSAGFVELYDRKRDPAQLQNVANLPKYRAVRRELARWTRQLADCSGADCVRRSGAITAPGVREQ